MFVDSAERLIKKIRKKKVIVVGGGSNGVELVRYFNVRGVKVLRIFDNNIDIQGHKIDGIIIEAPHFLEKSDLVYVISTNQPTTDVLYGQLRNLGINDCDIKKYYSYRSNEYLQELVETEYKDEISAMFLERIGYDMNWDSPKTYNEIINWEKINIRDDRRSILADKYRVRDWVKAKIGEKYLVRNYGVFDRVEDIDFSILPNQFVLKLNNGSSRNIIVKNKEIIDKANIASTLNKWRDENYAFQMLEMHYKDIVPKIICEEYIKEFEEGALDFKIYCFNGKPYYIQRIVGEHTQSEKALFYDDKWVCQEFNHYYKNDIEVSKPPFLEEMLQLTRVLCQDFKHVRVDWFVLPKGNIYFGEMTFSSWAGLMRFRPEKYDYYFGELIRKNEEIGIGFCGNANT